MNLRWYIRVDVYWMMYLMLYDVMIFCGESLLLFIKFEMLLIYVNIVM